MRGSDQEKQKLIFKDYLKPGLAAGTYTLDVTQNLTSLGGFPTLTQHVVVPAPQFSLEPGAVQAFYPPQGADGRYGLHLPFIVLNSRSLPWERTLTGGAPWLALLVFGEDEVSQTFSMTIEEYLKPKREVGDKEIESVVPIKDGDLDDTVNPDDACQCIEIPVRHLRTVAPRIGELPYLAHALEATEDKEQVEESGIDLPTEGHFACVLANRIPRQDKRNVVHLVSLQGCEDYLKSRDVTPEEAKQKIRLVSLANWSFFCEEQENKEEEDSFAQIVQGLLEDARGHLVRLPDPNLDAETPARDRLRRGFVPAPWHLQNGRDSLAWYRGPIASVQAPAAERSIFFNLSAALALDEATGVFDHSQAAAWQLGRLLALADQAFGLHVMDLRRKIHAELDRFYDRFKIVATNDAAFSSQEGIDKLVESIMTTTLTDQFRETVNKDFASTLRTFLDEPDRRPVLALEADARQDLYSQPIDDTDWVGFHDHYQGAFLKYVVEPRLVADVASDADDRFRQIDYEKLVEFLMEKFKGELDAIAAWLNELNIADIPFHYLLPNPALAPTESLRHFYLDASWWHPLYDGALSLGIHSEIDAAIYRLLSKAILKRAGNGSGIRSAKWGFFLRSRLVKGWGNLEVYALRDDDPVEQVFVQKIEADLLMFLFKEAPDELHLQTPREGLLFALRESGVNLGIMLRERSGNLSPKFVLVYFYDGVHHTPTGRGVININKLIEDMGRPLEQPVGAAELALHLTHSPDRFELTIS